MIIEIENGHQKRCAILIKMNWEEEGQLQLKSNKMFWGRHKIGLAVSFTIFILTAMFLHLARKRFNENPLIAKTAISMIKSAYYTNNSRQ